MAATPQHPPLRYFVSAPRGLVGLLARELVELGAGQVRERSGGVAMEGDLELGYRACLWSRLASRVLLHLTSAHADSTDALYAAARAIDWRTVLGPGRTFAIGFSQAQSPFGHTHFAALRVKDALVDQWRERGDERPSVDVERPDLRLHVHALRRELSFYLDLAGESLHRRAYRADGGAAPLRENLAAGLLRRAGWPELAQRGAALLDPMCGSGTFLVEAAWMAADVAPGLLRRRFGAPGWTGHDPALWQRLLDEAEARRGAAQPRSPIFGSDLDPAALRAAQANLERAGVAAMVQLERCDVGAARGCVGAAAPPGLLISNPPYGERLGDRAEAEQLHTRLGQILRRDFAGWRAALLCTDDALAARLGLRTRRRLAVYNGPLECQLLEIDLLAAEERERRERQAEDRRALALQSPFANRLRKNLRGVGRWARRQGLQCYRLYDADLPEYAVLVDVYGDWVHVQERQAPASVDPTAARQRLGEVLDALPAVLELPPEHVVLKTRARQRGRAQYGRQADLGVLQPVREGELTFLVNLHDYIDTGLFLDGRELRALIRGRAGGKRFLNLFGYTGTATVAAARGGASETTTVDLSATYLDWARRNLSQNGFEEGRRHHLVRADCLEWLRQDRPSYDFIYLDPPTFSNSRRMRHSFDVQRDHVSLLRLALARLAPRGELLFVSNRKGFKLDRAALNERSVEELSARTVPRDFARRPPHRSFLIGNPG